MKEYQQRMIAEKVELDQKRGRLSVFLASEEYKTLPEKESKLIALQAEIMEQYSEILGERIAAF